MVVQTKEKHGHEASQPDSRRHHDLTVTTATEGPGASLAGIHHGAVSSTSAFSPVSGRASAGRTVLEQRRAAARGSMLDFARTLERRAVQLAEQLHAGNSSTAASADLRCGVHARIWHAPWPQSAALPVALHVDLRKPGSRHLTRPAHQTCCPMAMTRDRQPMKGSSTVLAGVWRRSGRTSSSFGSRPSKSHIPVTAIPPQAQQGTARPPLQRTTRPVDASVARVPGSLQ